MKYGSNGIPLTNMVGLKRCRLVPLPGKNRKEKEREKETACPHKTSKLTTQDSKRGLLPEQKKKVGRDCGGSLVPGFQWGK